jgi:hypothetical protein
MNRIQVELLYEWEAILRNENEAYFFPQETTGAMGRTYRGPAIYRWNIYANTPSDRKLVYIGETQALSPRRIRGYLKPGPSQKTNQRLKSEFHKYLEQGLQIRLEVLKFDKIAAGDYILTPGDLDDKHVRRFIEGLLITYYKRLGFTVLNL